MAKRKTTLDEARRLIEKNAIAWYDFCATFGHLSDNVKHMPSIWKAFVAWLDGEE